MGASLADDGRLAMLTADKVRTMRHELEERAHETGALSDVLKQVRSVPRPVSN